MNAPIASPLALIRSTWPCPCGINAAAWDAELQAYLDTGSDEGLAALEDMHGPADGYCNRIGGDAADYRYDLAGEWVA